jgi:nucleoside-diphosphate-sugar epimerase
MPRILIAGWGYVGSATADLFQAAQWQVEGWTRSGHAAEKPYPIRAVDISDRVAVAAAASRFDAVIHCASSGGGGAESYRRIYLEGARNLISELQPRTFLYTSSTSVYAQTGGEWVDEESASEPKHETGKILRETEEFVRHNGGKVARLAGIYGPGRSALLRKLLSGEARIEAATERYLNQAHRDDIAAALFHLATVPNDLQIINISDDQPMTERDCYEWLAAKLDRPVPPVTSRMGEHKRGASNKRVSNRRLRGFGWQPRFPTFPSGMEESVLPAYPELGA